MTRRWIIAALVLLLATLSELQRVSRMAGNLLLVLGGTVLILVPVFLLLDYVWLGLLMSSFYRTELGDLARTAGTALAPRLWPAAIVYLLLPAGTLLFVLLFKPAGIFGRTVARRV